MNMNTHTHNANTTGDRIIRLPECCTITGRSAASIHRDENKGTFPARVRLGENAVGWRLSSVLLWVDSLEHVNTTNCKQVAVGSKRGRKPRAKVEA